VGCPKPRETEAKNDVENNAGEKKDKETKIEEVNEEMETDEDNAGGVYIEALF